MYFYSLPSPEKDKFSFNSNSLKDIDTRQKFKNNISERQSDKIKILCSLRK